MSRRRALAFKIAVPLLVFFAGEWLARHAFDLRGRLAMAERRTFAAYQGVRWADQYFKDQLDCNAQSARKHQPRYARYVLQDINEDCATQTVNYANRLRRTWNPDPAGVPRDATIYEVGMFGGSTMEGQGTIDEETIPSHFSKLANASSGRVAYRVTNYGVGGYTFTQSVFKFLTLLREGRHFDAVIFYDGANDVDYAYELGEVGGLAGEETVKVRLEGSLWARLRETGKEQVNACVLCMAGLMLARNTPLLREHLTPYLVRLRDAVHLKRGRAAGGDATLFAEGVATYYARSHELLARVAEASQVTHLEFWQPSLMFEAGYGPGEAPLARMDPRLTDAELRARHVRSRDAVTKMNLRHFVDISHVLDGRSRACYLDAVHLSGACNQVVARRIYDVWRDTQDGRQETTLPAR